jgi:hypothetical protein
MLHAASNEVTEKLKIVTAPKTRFLSLDYSDPVRAARIESLAEKATAAEWRNAEPPQLELLDDLIAVGLSPQHAAVAEKVARDKAFEMAATTLRLIFDGLQGSPSAIALRRVLSGDAGVTGVDEASALGISKQALAQKEGRIRDRLKKSPLTAAPMV